MLMRGLLAGFVSACLAVPAVGDSIELKTGRTLTGVIIKESEDTVTLAVKHGTLTVERSDVLKIDKSLRSKTEPESERTNEGPDKNRLPGWSAILMRLAENGWSTDLRQIPATVVDNGELRNVPYMSYQCGKEYEVNIYGDPDHPAGIEIGIRGKLLDANEPRDNCRAFIKSVLRLNGDRNVVEKLAVKADKKIRDGITFEITPPTAPDAYGGWWISVYDEKLLKNARASKEELARITAPRKFVASRSSSATEEETGGWPERDLARTGSRASKRTHSTGSGGSVYVR